nr:aminoacyl-tRNA hydrolase [Desulfobacterales bacterium]
MYTQIIVGLGNPGDEYRLSRHNIGFMVLDELRQRHNITSSKSKFDVVFGQGRIFEHSVILAWPMTFMNLNGPAVSRLMDYFKVNGERLLVVHDDMDLTFGKIKIKEKGGHGGHNGIRSLIEALGTGYFTRVRLGVGRPEVKGEVKSYVLDRFDRFQLSFLDDLISMACDAIETILQKGIKEAMNRFNGRVIEFNN